VRQLGRRLGQTKSQQERRRIPGVEMEGDKVIRLRSQATTVPLASQRSQSLGQQGKVIGAIQLLIDTLQRSQSLLDVRPRPWPHHLAWPTPTPA
jgi:hypothetical protein